MPLAPRGAITAWQSYLVISLLLIAPECFALGLLFPVDCQYRETCYIQYYVDIDPSDKARDFRDGSLTYNAHKGTDIALPTYRRMRRGVNVFAAAAGKVLRVRDGEPDLLRGQAGEMAIRQCGNGVVIQHEDNYETQYCHLKNHSLRVLPGDEVSQGQIIGQVGSSGMADFPHLHIALFHRYQVLDPFQEDLWLSPLSYQRTGLIDMGVSTKPLKVEAVLDKPSRHNTIDAKAKALIAWVRVYGTEQGDEQRYEFYTPAGKLYRKPLHKKLKADHVEWFSYGGFKRKANMPKGLWRAEYHYKKAGYDWFKMGEQSFRVN